MGSWAPDGLKFMKDLGSRVSEATEEKLAKSFLFQSISMNLQRGNALCVMGTVAQHRKLEEIYNQGTILTQVFYLEVDKTQDSLVPGQFEPRNVWCLDSLVLGKFGPWKVWSKDSLKRTNGSKNKNL